MRQFLLALAALLAMGSPAIAQDVAATCATPDSIAVRGIERVREQTARDLIPLAPGQRIGAPAVEEAIRRLFESGQFSDVQVVCEVLPTGRSVLAFQLEERPILGDVRVTGVEKVSERAVRERVDLLIGRPVDPAQVARAVARIDSLYESEGYYLATVAADTQRVDGRVALTFRIDEGRRLAISGVEVLGNERISDEAIVKALKTRPEGFFWFRRGELDEDQLAADLGERLPKLYGERGFVDFQVLHDTIVVDRERGKALLRLTVKEGPQYRVGRFDVIGNRRFSTEDIRRFYPFGDEGPTLGERVTSLVRRRDVPSDAFDAARWEEATQRVQTAYANEGYIRARVRPVVERRVGADSLPIVDLRWEIEEAQPAIVNRVEIAGNEYTSEACIRNQLLILPGDVFNQDRLVRSYRNIANLGFFEMPLPPPDTRPANDTDVDIVFRVKEKKTGNVNFGASVGQGTGLGGFISLEQPNLFGQCKRGSLQWQFGSYINDFQLTYQDPAFRGSLFSGTVSAYRTQSRFRIGELGRSTRIGGSLRVGAPLPRSAFTRVFASYGAEAVQYGNSGLLGDFRRACDNCLRSTLGLTLTRDTRLDLPFATEGSQQIVSAEFNGGPLGGTADFQRYTGEMRAYAPLGQLGGTKPGTQPVKFVVGLTARAGAVFGDPGPFFYSQKFALGGTQFGELLRGYDEFSITPAGIVPGTNTYQARVESFGNAFLSTTAEVGVRFNEMFYLSAFMDAGNIWNRPEQFNPTRLFRGAGIGLSTIVPALGPLGIDWAYGFDRVNAFGRRDPQWKLHFKLGQFF